MTEVVEWRLWSLCLFLKKKYKWQNQKNILGGKKKSKRNEKYKHKCVLEEMF